MRQQPVGLRLLRLRRLHRLPGLPRLLCLPGLLLSLSVLSAGCGTVVFRHTVVVSLVDPAADASASYAVSVFDRQSGLSEEWAGRTMRTVRVGETYTGEVTAVGTRMIFDRSLPDRVDVGLAIPSIEPDAYFALVFTPVDGAELVTPLVKVPYGDLVASGPADGPPVTATVRSSAGSGGWNITVHVSTPAR